MKLCFTFMLKGLSTWDSSLQHLKATALAKRITVTQLEMQLINLVCEGGKEHTLCLLWGFLWALSFNVQRKVTLLKSCLDLTKHQHRKTRSHKVTFISLIIKPFVIHSFI